MPGSEDFFERLRSWRQATHAAICDIAKPWAHGTVVRASRYPRYWDFNLVRVEHDPELDVDALIAVADEGLSGLAHRRIDFELAQWAHELRDSFESRGWLTERLLWMRHSDGSLHSSLDGVEEMPYERTRELRRAWHREDFPGLDDAAYEPEAEEVALRRGARLLTCSDGLEAVGFAQIESLGGAAEITQVYVHPRYRGSGRGTTLTQAAIAAAGDVSDLWICADEEERAKDLYARLGFRPVASALQFTLLPGAAR